MPEKNKGENPQKPKRFKKEFSEEEQEKIEPAFRKLQKETFREKKGKEAVRKMIEKLYENIDEREISLTEDINKALEELFAYNPDYIAEIADKRFHDIYVQYRDMYNNKESQYLLRMKELRKLEKEIGELKEQNEAAEYSIKILKKSGPQKEIDKLREVLEENQSKLLVKAKKERELKKLIENMETGKYTLFKKAIRILKEFLN
jgi:hypothetical protein